MTGTQAGLAASTEEPDEQQCHYLLLLCPTAASYDKRIALWDIGIPDCDYNFKAR